VLINTYGWDRPDRTARMAVGRVCFNAAWASLAVINGIITYMLAPGRWLQTHLRLARCFVGPTTACLGVRLEILKREVPASSLCSTSQQLGYASGRRTITFLDHRLSLKLMPGRGLVKADDPSAIVFKRNRRHMLRAGLGSER
jgi:hypothetical protein